MSATNFDHAEILREYNLTEDQFAKTTLEWDCLEEIFAHHVGASSALHTAAGYISERLQSVSAVHSLKVRIKDPQHLIAKIIRKKCDNPEREFQIANYESAITDLIGIRALHLFKDNWREIHNFITSTWELNEAPVANVRDGDPPELLASFRDAGCDVKNHKAGYRSLHYVVKSQPERKVILAEIQVRTIFEEGWSEIDHSIRYPSHSSDRYLDQFLTIFNRLAGSADEMGTFIQALSVHFREQATKVAGIQSQLTAKEEEVQKAISHLKINEDEKKALLKQIKEMQTSSRAAFSVDLPKFSILSGLPPVVNNLQYLASLASPGPFGPEAANVVLVSQHRCPKCGKLYLPNLTGPSSECPSCHANLGVVITSPMLP